MDWMRLVRLAKQHEHAMQAAGLVVLGLAWILLITGHWLLAALLGVVGMALLTMLELPD